MNLIIRNCVIALFDLKEVGGDFRFCSFDHILDRILVFCTKKFRFFGLVSVAVYGFCSISLSRFSVCCKNKIEFSDLLFDALQCFSGFSSENMSLNDLNRIHVFSIFACSFRFPLRIIYRTCFQFAPQNIMSGI